MPLRVFLRLRMECAIVVRAAIVVLFFEGGKKKLQALSVVGVAATCVYLQLQQAWGRSWFAFAHATKQTRAIKPPRPCRGIRARLAVSMYTCCPKYRKHLDLAGSIHIHAA